MARRRFLRVLIDDYLVRAAVNALHRFKIHAFARHVRRLFVLVIDLVELSSLTRRFSDGLQPIALGRLNDRGGLAARFRHHAIGVGLGLVAQPVLILLRRDHVLEGGDNLLRRVDRLQLHLQHQNARFVAVQHFLHEFLDVCLDLRAVDVQNLQDLAAADDFAHRAFGNCLHGFALIGDIEGIVLRMHRVDLPDDDEFHVGDMNRVAGFEVGADDYVTKPFSIRELVLRIDARLKARRPAAEPVAAAQGQQAEQERVKVGPLEIDRAEHRVFVSGEEIRVSALEMRLLLFLVKTPGKMRTRKELLTEVWGYHPEVSSRTLDTHVKRIRDKFGAAGNAPLHASSTKLSS